MGDLLEAERVPALAYPAGRFADPASWLVDEERKTDFLAVGAHHESRYYVTFLYLPPPDAASRTERLFLERPEGKTASIDPRVYLEAYLTETIAPWSCSRLSCRRCGR